MTIALTASVVRINPAGWLYENFPVSYLKNFMHIRTRS
jgi:hypothetical protein